MTFQQGSRTANASSREPDWPKIVITGASGGLGRALARELSTPGVTLVLWGRDRAKLDAVAQECRAAGAVAHVTVADFADLESALALMAQADDSHRFDAAFFASGIGDTRGAGDRVEDPALVRRVGQVNFVAPSALAAMLGDRMAARGRGTLVLVGSAAGFHALPFAAAYAASKAGLARFADALRLALRGHGVCVTLVSPGFIDTAAGRQVPGGKPLLMTPEQAARRIVLAARRRVGHAIFPWPFAVLRMFDRALPRFLRDRLLMALAPPG